MSTRNKKRITPETFSDPDIPTERNTSKPDDISAIKYETFLWILSILGGLALYFVIAGITVAVYHPDIDALKAEAQEVLLSPELASPKPVEQLLFRLGILAIIPALYVFYQLFSKMKWTAEVAQTRVALYFSLACIAALAVLVYFGFMGSTPPGIGKRVPDLAKGVADTNFNNFFDGFFIGDYLWVYLLIVVPLVSCLFLIGFKKYGWEGRKAFRIGTLLSGYIVIGSVLIAIVAMNTFLYPYSNENKYDFNAVYYSMTQVYAGVPMLVDGFTNTYGLYPHFLNPLFQLIGLDVVKFSLVMSLLLGVSFVLNFYTVKRFVQSRFLLFLGFTTMLFFSYFNRKLTTQFDCYFALFPIRYIIPSVLLFLAAWQFTKPSAIVYWVTTAVSAFFILWNPEIGMVCHLAWIAVNIYNDFYTKDGSVNVNRLIMHIVAGIGMVLIAFGLFKLLICICYGVWPDLGLLWRTTFVFSKVGLMLAPMPLFNPWNIFALILVIGFLCSIVKWHKKIVSGKASVIFLLSLIGLGYLMYYEGRSVNVTLSVSTGFCILLLTILGDELWQVVKKNNILVLNAFFVCFLCLISFSFVELFFNANRIYAMVGQEDDKVVSEQERRIWAECNDFIQENTTDRQKIFIMTASKFQGLYFTGGSAVSAFNPGLIDMHLTSDLQRYKNILRDSSFSVFIEPMAFYFPYMQRAVAEVAALYDYGKTHKVMALLNKRKRPLPAVSFFKSNLSTVIHRKYNDDSIGLKYRINDAFGIIAGRIDPGFSVQALFFVTPQIYKSATITGNMNEASHGFDIRNEFNSSNYIFCVNDQKLMVHLNYFNWYYIVMNVYPDHMDAYVNGELAASMVLSVPIQPSRSRISIGNLGKYPSYYIGAISEVTIDNAVVPAAQIKESWQQIASVIAR